ncbi:MAG: hypothetical protein C4329_02945 [Chitinophagaceae bacterium]
MLLTYRLPDFLDYLADHYQNLYQLYVGRLTELFPSSQSTDNLIIAEDDRTTQEQDNYVLQLWRRFIG